VSIDKDRDYAVADAVAALAAIPLIILLDAWTAATFWGWFAVPLGAPVIGKAFAYGIGAVLAWATRSAHTAKQDDTYVIQGAVREIASTIFYLIVAWAAHTIAGGAVR
jgi:hypothetical protein